MVQSPVQPPNIIPVAAAQAPVVVFDSGVGGLSVLRSLLDELPEERFIYVADSAYVPYGDRAHSVIVDRTLAIARHARNVLGAKAFVIACNTATAAAVAQVRSTWPDWVVVGIEPAVKPAAMRTRSGVIGILATSNTLASERFASLVEGFAGDCKVVAQPCPGLVECIEAGDLDGPRVRALLAGFVAALLEKGADVIVLGCTHYPFVAGLVGELAGARVQVLETGEAVARETRRRLGVEGLLLSSSRDASCDARAHALVGSPIAQRVRLLATGSPGDLASAAKRLLALSLPCEQVNC